MDAALDVVRQEPDATRHLLHLLQQLQHAPKRQPTFNDPCEDIIHLVEGVCTLVHAIPEPLRADLLRVTAEVLFFHPWKGHNPCLLRLQVSVFHQILALQPPGHCSHVKLLYDLGTGLSKLCQLSGSLPAVEEAIACNREALQLCPPGHTDRAKTLKSLGISLYLLCDMTGKLDALKESIDLIRQSLELCPFGHADRADTLNYLGSSLYLLCEMTGQLDALEESIGLLRQSLEISPPDHKERLHTLESLGTSLFLLCQMTGKLGVLEESIELKRQALQLCPANHVDRPRTLKSLGISLHLLYQMTSKLDALEESIELQRQALQLCPPDHPDRVLTLNSLGVSLFLICQMTGHLNALEESVELQRQALQLCPPDHANRAHILNCLGSSLYLLCEMTGNLDALKESIDLDRQSLELCPPGHADRAHTLKSLGISLHLLCQLTGSLDALEESAEVMRQSLELCPADHADRAHTLRSLSCSLYLLCQMTGKLDALEESIELDRQSLQLCPPDHVDRAPTLKSLGSSLFLLCRMSGNLGALEESIELTRQSLQLCLPDHADRAHTLNMLGASLLLLSQMTGKLDALKESIELKRESLSLCSPGHPDRAQFLKSLGISQDRLCRVTGGLDALAECIELKRQSLGLCPPGHADRALTLNSLGASLHLHFLGTQNEESFEESINLQFQAIQYARPGSADLFWSSKSLGVAFLTKYSHTGQVIWLSKAIEHVHIALSQPMVPAHTRLQKVNTTLNNIYSALEQPTPLRDIQLQLFCTFSEAVHLLPYAAYFGLHATAQLTVLHSSEGLGSRTCMLALMLNNPQGALELFEEAHGVFWLQALKVRSPLDSLPEQERVELTRLFQVLEAGVQPQQDQDTHWQERQTALLRQASARAEEVIDNIRKRDGFDRFLLPPLFRQLAHVAARGPVIVLVSHDKLCEAIVILDTEGSIKRVALPGVSCAELLLLGKQVKDYNLRRGKAVDDSLDSHVGIQGPDMNILHSDCEANEDSRFRKMNISGSNALRVVPLHRTWTTIVYPIIEALQLTRAPRSRDRPRVHWCATGPFAFVPLHAAETNSARCTDYLVSSYTPTLTALLHARRGLRPMPLADMTALMVAVEAADKLPRLTSAVQEIQDSADILSPMKRVVYGAEGGASAGAGVREVINSLPTTSFFHLACHGAQDMKDPLQSAFYLQDGKLTVEDLMKLDLKDALFAFLSACETAKGDENHRDQAVHLGAAMLFVGFRSIIGTMWSMNDEDGPFVAKTVYTELVKKETLDLDDIPYALDLAVEQLHKRGVGPHRWAPYIHMGA